MATAIQLDVVPDGRISIERSVLDVQTSASKVVTLMVGNASGFAVSNSYSMVPSSPFVTVSPMFHDLNVLALHFPVITFGPNALPGNYRLYIGSQQFVHAFHHLFVFM